MRTTLRIDDDLANWAKRQAASEGVTLTALIERALRESRSKRKQRSPRRELPTSDSGGGLREGVDLADGSAVRDLMDGLEG